jgi:hypothetical protein
MSKNWWVFFIRLVFLYVCFIPLKQKQLVTFQLTFQPPPAWMNATSLYNYTASELTPSESLMTEDDDDIEVRVCTVHH